MRSAILTIIAIMIAAASVQAAGNGQTGVKVSNQQIQHGPRFVDENGDGFNDLAPDHDNDGIPNGQDPDWIKPLDGSGNGGAQRGQNGAGFIDDDNGGICDNYTGSGAGRGGDGFIDADNDGVCDNFGSNPGRGGQGHRGAGGR